MPRYAKILNNGSLGIKNTILFLLNCVIIAILVDLIKEMGTNYVFKDTIFWNN